MGYCGRAMPARNPPRPDLLGRCVSQAAGSACLRREQLPVIENYIFSAMRSFALLALGLAEISASPGTIGFLEISFSVAL